MCYERIFGEHPISLQVQAGQQDLLFHREVPTFVREIPTSIREVPESFREIPGSPREFRRPLGSLGLLLWSPL